MKVFLTSLSIIICLATREVRAFAFVAPSLHSKIGDSSSAGSFATTTTLHLLPTHGNQLVAAGACAYGVVSEEDDDTLSLAATTSSTVASSGETQLHHPHQPTVARTATKAARSFVSRVFRLPASLRHPKEEDDDDIVGLLYPVVGFTYVQDHPDHCRALPTISNPSCRLHPVAEEVYGWYSAACLLNAATYDDDGTLYSQEPENHA